MVRFTLILTLFPLFAFGQTTWTLDQCIDTAWQNNSSLKQSRLNVAIAEVNRSAEKNNYLPTLNSNITHGYNWGQTIDPFTNQFATNRSQYNNFALSSSVTLFSGLQNQYKRILAEIDSEIALSELEIARRNLGVDVIAACLVLKLNEKIVEIRKKHLELSRDQLVKTEILVNENYEVNRVLLEVKAQVQKEQYNLLLAENDLKMSIYNLQTLLGIDYDSSFELSDSIFFTKDLAVAEDTFNQLQINRELFLIKLSKSSLFPHLSLNGFLGSGYSGNNQYLNSNGQFAPKPFGTQLNENLYQSASINLTIPIFNGTKTYGDIKISELEYQRTLIENEERGIQLKKIRIEQLLEIDNQKAALVLAKASAISYEALFRDTEIELAEKTVDYYSFLQSKNALFEAEAELVQAEFRLTFAEIMNQIFH